MEPEGSKVLSKVHLTSFRAIWKFLGSFLIIQTNFINSHPPKRPLSSPEGKSGPTLTCPGYLLMVKFNQSTGST